MVPTILILTYYNVIAVSFMYGNIACARFITTFKIDDDCDGFLN